jgi:uroporphyrinogen-III synthase
MASGPLADLRVVAFEARRAEELATLLGRHGASVTSAPALQETRLSESPAALELVERLDRDEVGAVVLLTGVGTRALAAIVGDAAARLLAALGRVPVVARGPKPLAALRELGVTGALPVPAPHTWREALAVLDGVGLAPGSLVAVQEYGVPPLVLVQALEARGLRVLRVPVYRWALPEDTGPLERAASGLVHDAFDVAVFTSAVQVEHLFRVAPDPAALREGLARTVVVSIGPVCSEALEAHDVHPRLEPSPPKLGPLVALIAARAPALIRATRDSVSGRHGERE